MQRRLQKGILAFTEDRPITRVFKASKQINHFDFLPSHLALYCCFSEGLNAEYVKGENMEAVVSEEPQVKSSVLETQSAEPPKQDSAKM